MNLGLGQYRCDCCGTVDSAKRLPFGWHRRGNDHICPKCWPSQPPERTAVFRYGVTHVELPDSFWSQQRAARALWDGLVEIGERTLRDVQALRAQYAPGEVWVYEEARERARVAWLAVESASRASAGNGSVCASGDNMSRRDVAKRAAQDASRQARDAYAVAKRAAKAAGCDERPLWAARDAAIAHAPQWQYEQVEVDGRRTVQRCLPGEPAGLSARTGWRLQRGLADQVCDEYRTAWQAWISQTPSGRGLPRARGQRIGDQVRMVLRYTNGTALASLERGTPLCAIVELWPDPRSQGQRRGGRFVALHMACGGQHLIATVHLHRPIPAGTDVIRVVALVGRQFADRWQWSLHVTCRTPALQREPAAHRAEAVAIDLRWRQDSQDPQYLLVAEWLGDNGAWGRVLVDTEQQNQRQSRDRGRRDGPLPSSWRDYAILQTVMDWCLEGIKFVVWAQQENDCEKRSYSQAFRLLRAQGLLRAIREQRYPESCDALAVWQQWYMINLRRLARLRQRLIGRRDQLYYESAHSICAHAETIVLEADVKQKVIERAMDLRPLAEAANAMAGNQRHLLAPGRFRQMLTRIAPQYGTAVVLIDKNRTSTTCPSCGAVRAKGGAAEVLTCPNGHQYDQKIGAATELLARWREQRGDGGNSGGARGPQVPVTATEKMGRSRGAAVTRQSSVGMLADEQES